MPVLLWHIKPRWLPLKRSILTNLQNRRRLWTSRRKLTFFSSLLGDNKLLFLNGNNFMQSNSLWKIWRANKLYMPYMAGTAERNFNPGGDSSKLAQEMQVCWGGGPWLLRLGNGIFNILNEIFLCKNSTWIRC